MIKSLYIRSRLKDGLKDGFYWPGMKEYAKNYFKSSFFIQKTFQEQSKSPMVNYIVRNPFEQKEIDIFGSLPITKSGNRY